MSQISPNNSAESAHLQRLSIAAVEELRQTVRSVLSGLLGKFLKELPATLSVAASKVTVVEDRRAYDALTQSLITNFSRWVETFVQHVDAHLIGGVVPDRPVEVQTPSRADDAIMLAKVELRAEARYRKLVTEMDARVNRLRLMLYVPVHTKSLAPAGLARSLRDTADALGWPGKYWRLLFDKFDTVVINELELLYRSLIDALTRIGTEAAKAGAMPKREDAPRSKRLKSPTTMEPPADTKSVDAETISMLQSFALRSEGMGYTDGLLAADLLALADHRPLPGVAQDQSWVPIQRISLAGHFLNEVTADPMIPDALKPQHETVRFPMVKSALTDRSVFDSMTHPLNSLINEMLLKSATSRVTGNKETRRVSELLQEVLTQFDLAPEFVRQAMQTSEAIDETQIQRFFELQRQQAQQRRDFVIAEAKRAVTIQLERSTFGRGVPASALKFLNIAWGPLLTKRLLQHGADHALSNAGHTLMEQLLDQLDVRQPDEQPPAEWKELTQTMAKALIAEGMAADRVALALASLETARKSAVEGIG